MSSKRLNATQIAADDHMRSEYVRYLLSLAKPSHAEGRSGIPLLLVQFWDDSKAIPPDVKECIDSWRPLEAAGFTRILFDDATASQFIADNYGTVHTAAFARCEHPAMRSDYFRLCFIAKMGGFYVDADDVYLGGDIDHQFRDSSLKLQPLCYDISKDAMVDPHTSQVNGPASKDLTFYVNNNPIIAPAGHAVVQAALRRSTQLLLQPRIHGAREVQSVTGPGNLTACLVEHAVEAGSGSAPNRDFALLEDWETVAESKWPLDYRNDERNWRLWSGRG